MIYGFYGHGKDSVYDNISRVSHLQDLIINVKKAVPLSDSVRKVIKTFVIQAICGDGKSKTSGEARSFKWKHIKKEINALTVP